VTDDELRSRLSVGALRHAREFSWDRTADRTLEVYRQAQASLALVP